MMTLGMGPQETHLGLHYLNYHPVVPQSMDHKSDAESSEDACSRMSKSERYWWMIN